MRPRTPRVGMSNAAGLALLFFVAVWSVFGAPKRLGGDSRAVTPKETP